MEIEFYSLVFFNFLMLLFLVFFVYSRGGLKYLKAKYKQIKQGENIHAATLLLRQNVIESFLKAPSHKTDIFMIGDSITEYGRWAEYMGDERFKNRGLGGETSSNLKEWFLPLVQKKPESFVLLVGINSFKAGVTHELAEKYIDDLNYFCEQTASLTKGYIVSILPINEPMSTGFIYCRNKDLLEINTRIEELTTKFSHIEYANVFFHMLDDKTGQLNPEFTVDGAHLTYSGYMKYISALKPIMKEQNYPKI